MNTAHQRGMSEGYNRGQLRYDYRDNQPKHAETQPDENQAEISPGSIPRRSHVVPDAIQDQSSSKSQYLCVNPNIALFHCQKGMSLRANFEDSTDQYMIEYQDENIIDEDPNTLDEFAYTGHAHKGMFPTQPKHSFEQQMQHHLHPIQPIKKSQWLGGENPVVWVQKQLHAQYFDIFNFYFAKGINEILANLNISHVILFKDYLFLDDDSEYLKRYYFKQEVPPRFNLLTDFYTNQYKQTRPNLCTIGPAKIIAKRNYKQAKLFVKNQERLFKLMNGENPDDQGNAEDDGDVLVQSNNNDQEGGEESAAGGGRRRQRLSNLLDELDQPTDHSACQDTYTLSSQNNPLQTELQEDATERDTSTSFESRSHDIYYPSFSSKGENSNENQNALNTQKSIENKDDVLKLLPQIYADVFVSNANIRPRGCFMALPQNSVNDLRDQKLEKQVVIVEYNELADIEMDLPAHLQVYLNQGAANPLGYSDKQLNNLEIPQKQGIALTKTLEVSSSSLALPLKRIKPLTIKSYDEESKQDDNLGIHVAVVMAPNSARTNGSVRQRDDRLQSRHNNNINSSGLSQTQPTNSGAVRGALLAEYLSQENPLSCRASSTLLNSQFSRNGGDQQGHQGLLETIVKAQQQQQQQSSSLLNRLPANMRKQLVLNLQENDQIVKNLRQNDVSPDRIWTDRDVNPRPAAYPNGNTAAIGKGELRLIKNGKCISSNLQGKDSGVVGAIPTGSALLGVTSMEKRQMLSRISEDPLEKHTHPAITNILLNAIAKSNSNHHLSNTSNNHHNIAINNQHNPNSTSTTPNSHNTNTQFVISSANNSNINNNNNSSNNLQSHSQNYSQKAMQLKIIQNAVSNQVARISSQTSNVQDVYKKYQQMVMEEQNQQQQLQQQQQNFMGRTSQELQSFRSSGSSNSLHNFQPMSFFKASRNPQGGAAAQGNNGQEENNNNNNNGQETNFQMNSQLLGISNPISQQYQQFIQDQKPQHQQQQQSYQSAQLLSLENSTSKHVFPEGILMGSTAAATTATATVQPASSTARYGNSNSNSNKAKMNAVIAKAASHGLSAVTPITSTTTPQSHVTINKRIIGSPNNSNTQLKQTSMVKANKSSSTIQQPLKEHHTKSIRTSSLIKNLSGDELNGGNNNIMNICMNMNDSSTQKTARQTPQAQSSRKTPNYSTQNDKIFFTSINNNNHNKGIAAGLPGSSVGSSLKHSAMNLPSTKNANSKTIHAANSYVSPSNARAAHLSGNQLSSKQLSSPAGPTHKSYQDSHQTSLERNRLLLPQHHFNGNHSVSSGQQQQQQPLTRGFIDLNSFTSNLNPTPVNQQNAIILPFNQGTTSQTSRNSNNNNSHSNTNRTSNPHLSSNNNNNTSGNLTNSINIHNINNNININNINVPEISGQSNLSVNTLTMNNLHVNQINLANFMQSAQNEQTGNENGVNNPTIQNTMLTQGGGSEIQLLTRNTQHTQGNPGQIEESSKTNSPMAGNHKQQKSDGLIQSIAKINKAGGGTAVAGASSMGIPFDSKSPRQNQLNVQQAQQQLQLKQPSLSIPQQQGQQQNPVSLSNSQLRKQELKLNISKIINQQQEYTQNICSATNYNNTERNGGSSSSSSLNPTGKSSNFQFLNEENQENSYGFWTSRSSKQGQQQQHQSTQQGQNSVNSINSLKYSSLMASKNNNNNNNPNSVERKQGTTDTNNGMPDYPHNTGNRFTKKDPQAVPNNNNNNNLIIGSSSNHQAANLHSNNYNFGAFSERGLSHKSPSHTQKQNSLKPSPQIRNHSNNNNNNIPASSSVVKTLQLPGSSNVPGKGNLLGSNGRKSPTCIEDVLAYKKSAPSVQSTILQATTKR